LNRLLFIGDSLTEYFDWARRFPEFEVTNLGIAGETVEELLGRMSALCASVAGPDIIFLMTGINNIAMEDFGIIETYRAIVKSLTACFTQTRVVIQSILPVRLPWVETGNIAGINRAIEELSNQLSVVYLDLFKLFIDSNGGPIADYLLEDGVHLSSRGYAIWADAVEEFLRSSATSLHK
jgi:lysophospholipase L1-like esterase